MNANDQIVLYIVLRQSLHIENDKAAYYAANAVQHLLMKYFTLQLVAVKTNLKSLINDEHLKTTTSWLASQSKKVIVSADDTVWEKLKTEFSIGKDMFCLKNPEIANVETTLVLWPSKYNDVPLYIRDLKLNS